MTKDKPAVLTMTPAVLLYQRQTVGRALVLLQRMRPHNPEEGEAVADLLRRLRELAEKLDGGGEL